MNKRTTYIVNKIGVRPLHIASLKKKRALLQSKIDGINKEIREIEKRRIPGDKSRIDFIAEPNKSNYGHTKDTGIFHAASKTVTYHPIGTVQYVQRHQAWVEGDFNDVAWSRVREWRYSIREPS